MISTSVSSQDDHLCLTVIEVARRNDRYRTLIAGLRKNGELRLVTTHNGGRRKKGALRLSAQEPLGWKQSALYSGRFGDIFH